MLFVPANSEKLVASAAKRGADAVILDLEDAVAPSQKSAAREAVRSAASVISGAGTDVFVRINRPWRLAVRDLEHAVGPHVRGLLLPKVDAAHHVQAVADIVSELELASGAMTWGQTCLVPRLEDTRGLARAHDIAAAHPRVAAIGLGAGDFISELGADADGDAVRLATFQVILAARAAGVEPLGLTTHIADFKNLDKFRESARVARGLGATGSPCIHPSQVSILNEEFAPSRSEIDWAERIVAAYSEAVSAGVGAIMVGDEFVDVPVYQQALALLAQD